MTDYFLLVLLWAGFYASHSILASVKVKRILEQSWSLPMKWYRLSYSALSVMLLVTIIGFSVQISLRQLFPSSPFGTYIGYMLASFGTIILVKSAKSISLGKFIGFQAERQDSLKLVTSGIYSRIRHPLYAGLLLIFLGYFFVSPTLTVLIHSLCLVIYLPIGIKFEEQNLVSIFGEDYMRYQKNVPPILPWLGTKKGA